MKNEWVELKNNVILIKFDKPEYYFAINSADFDVINAQDEWFVSIESCDDCDNLDCDNSYIEIYANVIEDGETGTMRIEDCIQANLMNRGNVPDDISVLFKKPSMVN